jgi:hypothetical protein
VTRIHVDGITHRASGRNLACGMTVFDRRLDAIMKMFLEGEAKEVDCMACIAEGPGNEE